MRSLYGVSLTGGGARGAYQAGGLKALSEILLKEGFGADKNPLKYWSGVSAGSINATHMASHCNNLSMGADELIELWSKIEPEQVYKTDFLTLSTNSLKWIRDLSFGELFRKKMAQSLLDTEPLWELLNKNLDLGNLEKQIKSGHLLGLASSAYSYKDNRTVTFCQGEKEYNWNRHRRYSKNVKIKTKHIVASCSIPLLFPPIKVDNEYFADAGFVIYLR